MLKMQVMGNLGSDCVVREVNSKYAVSFSVAHNEKYKDSKGVPIEKTVWLNCTIWRKKDNLGKLHEFLKKGTGVYVEGNPNFKTYVNDDTGEVLPDVSLRVTNLQFTPSTRNKPEPAKPEGPQKKEEEKAESTDWVDKALS